MAFKLHELFHYETYELRKLLARLPGRQNSGFWYYKVIEYNEELIAHEAVSFGDGIYCTCPEMNDFLASDFWDSWHAFTLYKLQKSTFVDVHAPFLNLYLQCVPGLVNRWYSTTHYDAAAIIARLDLFEATLSTPFFVPGYGDSKVLQFFIDCIRGCTPHTPSLLTDHYSKSFNVGFDTTLLDDMDGVDQHMRLLFALDCLKFAGTFAWRRSRRSSPKFDPQRMTGEDDRQASLFDQRYAATMQQRQRARLFETFNDLHSTFVTISHQKGASNQYRRLGRRFYGPLRLYEAGSSAMRQLLHAKEAPRDIAGTFGAIMLADAMRQTLGPASGSDEDFLRDIGPWYAQLSTQEDRELFEEMALAMWNWTPAEVSPRGQIDTEKLERLVDELRGQLEILIPRTAQFIRQYDAEQWDVPFTERSEAQPIPKFDSRMEEVHGAQAVGKDIPPEPPDISFGNGLLSQEIPCNVLILLMGCVFKAYIAFLIRLEPLSSSLFTAPAMALGMNILLVPT